MDISDKYSFRFAEDILGSVKPLSSLWQEVLSAIYSISDEDIKRKHLEIQEQESTKSLSKAINQLLDQRLKQKGWNDQSGIFSVPEYQDGTGSTWTLDFSKGTTLENGETSGVAIEVAFNHAEAAAWNLTKPMLAAEIRNTITVPIMLLGLAAPKTFKVQPREQKNSPYKSGEIIPISD